MADSVLEFCGYTNRTVTMPLAQNPNCPCDHSAWEIAPAPRALRDCTLRELLAAAAMDTTNGPTFSIESLNGDLRIRKSK